MGIRLRKLTKEELAAAKKKKLRTPPPKREKPQTSKAVQRQRKAAREAWHKKDFKDAERRGKGIFTPAELKQIKEFEKRKEIHRRAKLKQKTMNKKKKQQSTRGYA